MASSGSAKWRTAGRGRHHAREDATHYTVIESVRTEKGPRQRVVASWTDAPGLAEAIERAQAGMAELQHEADDWRELWEERGTWADSRRRCTWTYRRWLTKLTRIAVLRRQAERLERARAVLGDWRDGAPLPIS